MDFEVFKDTLQDYVYENMDLGNRLADKLNEVTNGKWDNRTYHYQPDFVALNVKGKGTGDYSKVSDTISEDDYYQLIERNISMFFNNWETVFKEEFGLTLDVTGRSGGWWGFKADDLTDFNYVLQLKEDKVKELYSKMNTESVEESIYNVFDSDEIDYFFEQDFFDFREEFVTTVNNFVEDINSASEDWESDEWNNEIKSFYE